MRLDPNFLFATLRLSAGIIGAAGGAINAVSSFVKAEDAFKQNNSVIGYFYLGSMVAFGGTIATSTLAGAGALAETLVARGIGGAAVRAIAIRFGGQGAASLLGISVTGWGLLLLGAGVACQIIAIAMTPTPIQQWIGRSYFGKDSSLFSLDGVRDDMFPKGNWQVELEGLQEALKEAS